MTLIDREKADPPISEDHVNAATCSLSRGAMIEMGDTIASLGISLREAAWRDSSGGVRLHMMQLRETFKVAIDILKRWESAEDGRRGE